MSTAAESINNAINAADFRSAALTAGSRKAVQDLASHWQKFWNSPQRRTLPELVLRDKLGRYVEWYARAWLLFPPRLRAQLPDPRTLDTSFARLAEQQMRQTVDVYASAAAQGVQLADSIAHEARKLVHDVGQGAADTLSAAADRGERVIVVAAVAVVALLLLSRR